MKQIAVVLSIFILLGALGKPSSNSTYKMKVCAGVIYDYREINPDCSVTTVGGERYYP